MAKPTRSLPKTMTNTDDVEFCRSMFSSLKSNLSTGRSRKPAQFHAHFLASRRLVDSLHMKPKQVEAKKQSFTRTRPPPSKELLEANRRMEAIQNATRGDHRIVAWEDDADRDILAAIVKADCR